MHFWGAATYFCIYTNFSEKYTSNPALTILLTCTFQTFFVCVNSIGQRSSSPDELNDTLQDKIALPGKLHANAIFSQITWIVA